MTKMKLGYILHGSLVEGFYMRLLSHQNLEQIKTGKFVTILGKEYRFFSLITDLELQVTNPEILIFPPQHNEKLLADLLKKHDMYTKVLLRPMLMINKANEHTPVKSIPDHFTPVYESTEKDIADVFGNETKRNYFHIGSPIDMETPVCLDLSKFTERSNGIFGKTGTGKTFLTRLILSGLIKTDAATNLVFDMHSEYGVQARQEGTGKSFVKGLKTLFPHKVAIFSLDPASTRQRGCSPDHEVIFDYHDIRVDDILSLQDELNLHPTALEAAHLITLKYKRDWLSVLLQQEGNVKDFAHSIGAHPESVGALFRKLKRLERLPFVVVQKQEKSSIKTIIEYLEQGIHVILEFGKQTSMFCYLLISNIITRRIHARYIEKTERFIATQKKEDQPQKLVITIEEAHKFLNPITSKQTIFGVIAREMRKYFVSLLLVDQRPSSIDQEIISQIGTKLVALLNDEKDINAVLTGINNAHSLRTVLSTLDAKKQALLFGYSLPMPVVIKTREYDENFYKIISDSGKKKISLKSAIEEIY
jgi:uncharacterized protein